MATSAAKIRSNRLNSKKSTGPRTAAGKDAVRFNSVTHGATARTPVFPWESQALFDQRVHGVKLSIRPVGDPENVFCEQFALASWQHERAVRATTARATYNVHTLRKVELERAEEQAAELGHTLLMACGPVPLYPVPAKLSESGATSDSRFFTYKPSRLVAKLESTHAGCRWLLARFGELHDRLEGGQGWHPHEKLKMVRLLGRQPLDAADVTEVALVYLCSHVIEPFLKHPFYEIFCELDEFDMRRFGDRLKARNVYALSPADASAAREILMAMVDRNIERLTALAAERLAFEDAMNALRHDIMGFDDSVEGERLRRHMNASERAMHRALDTIIKMRKNLEIHQVEPAADAAGYSETNGETSENEHPDARQVPGPERGGEDCLPDVEQSSVVESCVTAGRTPAPHVGANEVQSEAPDPDLQSKATVTGNEPQGQAALAVSKQSDTGRDEGDPEYEMGDCPDAFDTPDRGEADHAIRTRRMDNQVSKLTNPARQSEPTLLTRALLEAQALHERTPRARRGDRARHSRRNPAHARAIEVPPFDQRTACDLPARRENDPPSGAPTVGKPGQPECLVRDVRQGEHIVDPEPGGAQLALELTPAIEVNAHAGDTAVAHLAVAELGSPQECSPSLAPQPLSSLAVAQVQPEIVNVQGHLPARPQDSSGLLKCAAPLRTAADHTEGAEHRQCIVEQMIGETAEPAEIGLYAIQIHVYSLGFESHGTEHRPRKVHGGHGKSALGKPNCMAARSASQVNQPPRGDEPRVESPRIGPEQRMIGEIRVLVGRQPRRVRVFPQRRIHTLRQPPRRRHSRNTHVAVRVRVTHSIDDHELMPGTLTHATSTPISTVFVDSILQ
jgi:hypothetical protein